MGHVPEVYKGSRFFAVALDVTEHCGTLPRGVERAIEVFAVDADEVTHLCEATPSFYMVHVYNTCAMVPGATDEDREAADTWAIEAGGEDTYMHCADMWRRVSVVAAEKGEPEDTLEDWREHWQGNCPA
jgi:hypothetical protein